MKNNIRKYLSEVATKLNPYLWEKGIKEDSLRFDTNTMPFPPKSLPIFLKEMQKKCPINEYSDPSYKRLKELIADYENVDENMITVTNSGDEAIDILAKAFLNPGDYFVTTPPTYEMFEIQCGINKGLKFEVPLVGKGFQVDGKKIVVESKKTKVKIIFLVNPNNPTASIIPQKTVEKIVKNSDAIVVLDEVYREFYRETAVPFLKKYKNLVILRSFSKFAGLAGARVGYLIANPYLTEKFDAIRLCMGVSFLSYKLAEIVLENDGEWIKEQVEMIKNERQFLTREFESLGFKVYPSQANFLLVKIGRKASQICIELKQKGIIVRDRSSKPYLNGCARITVRSPRENRELIKVLKEILNEKNNFDAIIFDMDGVIVDVSKSYREAIRQTASYFLQKEVKMKKVNRIKRKKGMNNDWDATFALINNKSISYDAVKNYFQSKYLGDDKTKGLIFKEKLLIPRKQFQKLKNKYRNLGIVTGRPKKEALFALRNFNLERFFPIDNIIAMEDTKKWKPDPEPLLKIKKRMKLNNPIYIGDTIDDVVAAKNAKMSCVYIGREKLGDIQINNVNQLEEIFL